MQIAIIFRILGIFLMLFSLTMLPPMVVSIWFEDGAKQVFLVAFAIILATGIMMWLPVARYRRELRIRDGFVITVLFWAVLGLFGSLPFLLADDPHLSTIDAIFESMSGLTTTGATVITGLDDLPKSILFYRQQLQLLGGMGIIVLAVAVLPMLGIGGMQLYRAETPGPMKDNKLTPRITETAKALWIIYIALTFLCGVAYWLAGMDVFDAIAHSFSTVAIGGFSTHDASIGYYQNPAIEMVAMCFMIISGANFALHFYTWRRKTMRHYFADPEFKAYIFMLLVIGIIASVVLISTTTYDTKRAIEYGFFEVISIATTTGFATADFAAWPHFLPFLLFLSAFVGACAGSTGGGMKVIRVLLIYKQGMREIKRLIHPNATILVKLGKKPVGERVIEAVWGFFSVYVIVFIILLMLLLGTGLDFTTAFSAVGACINNLGPGLGDVAENYGQISASAKTILCFAMLVGRLEVFTLLVLLTPMFWQR